ncbi:PH domain-containing protein [Micromonospora craniellae]|uniref:PH domain-containing protein n=1 Tax=Micromonospora craniellae TaxID=2294034 RepID=A0A372FZF4_9ACTN|nr:PH domain-containing protein [Micromonospora craniellae]QOC94436.1 PH domain-containing protein [Micromonospora craniellae]RFS46152.1 PH domain-containing protein [Micromonospora craniellae]
MTFETVAREWRVRPALPILKLVGAVGLFALGLLLADGDLLRPALGVLTGAALAAWGVRDLVAPVHLAVDADGVTVPTGWWTGRRHLPWSTIETIEVDRRAGRGVGGPVLEIDTGESLHLFTRHDLAADPDEVADALRAARPATG